MTPEIEAALAAHRDRLSRQRGSQRLKRFALSERSMVLRPFDPTRGAWPLNPSHRKFSRELRALAREGQPRKDLLLLHGFAVWRSETEVAQAPRWITPLRFDAASGCLQATGPAERNLDLPEDLVVDRATIPAGATVWIEPDTAVVIFVESQQGSLAASLDPERNPSILDNPILRRLIGAAPGEGGDVGVDTAAEPARPDLGLDAEQAWARREILEGRDVAVIGPPGCGKSQVIVSALAGAPAGRRIAVTSTEASALDMIRRRLVGIDAKAEIFVAAPDAVAAAPLDRPFDQILVDEGARMSVSVGLALAARTRQLVVFGDPLQLAPHNGEPDLLSHAMACGWPRCDLPWHYRSATASLITPSNLLLYQQRLRAVPSPDIGGDGLTLTEHRSPRVASVEGRSVNCTEADAILDELARHVQSGNPSSICVISLQRDQTNFLRRRIEEAKAEGRFDPADLDRKGEPFFVRDADRVQGEERDVVILSTAFTRHGEATIRRFGVLTRERPLQLLNVALTRARIACSVHVSHTIGDVERLSATPGGLALVLTLKAIRLVTRTENAFEIDGGLSWYARRRALKIRHLGIVQALFADGDRTYRLGVMVRDETHDAVRWASIAGQLRAKGWPILETTKGELEQLAHTSPSSLEVELDRLHDLSKA